MKMPILKTFNWFWDINTPKTPVANIQYVSLAKCFPKAILMIVKSNIVF